MFARRFCNAFGLLGLLGQAAGDREREDRNAQDVFSGAEIREHIGFKSNVSFERSSLSIQYCCLVLDEGAVAGFDIDSEDSTYGTIEAMGSGANFDSCRITALPSGCLNDDTDAECLPECKKKIKESKHYWHFVVDKMKKDLDRANEKRETAIKEPKEKQKKTKDAATKMRDAAIKALGTQIVDVGNDIKNGKAGVGPGLQARTKDLKALSVELSEAQDETHNEPTKSAELIWKEAHDAADALYKTEEQDAAGAELTAVDDAGKKLKKAIEKYNAASTPQNVPLGCTAERGWEGNRDIPGANNCCCSLCAGSTCKGVRTENSFIDWDQCFTDKAGVTYETNAKLKHEAYSWSVKTWTNCDAFHDNCDKCKAKACGKSMICPTSAEKR